MQKITQPDIDVTWFPLAGGASPPSTPAVGAGIIFGGGTSNITLRFMNETGNLRGIPVADESGLRVLRGRYTKATPPVVSIGSGWSVVRNATGDTTVTFTTAFATTPVVTITAERDSSGNNISPCMVSGSLSTSGFRVICRDNANSALDCDISFIAIGT